MTDITRKIKKPSIILASKCRENKILSRTIKQTLKKKFKSQHNLKVSVIVTAKMGYRNKPRSVLFHDAVKFCEKNKFSKHFNNLAFEYIDCSSRENLKNFKASIKKNKIILVLGGDTFYLQYHLHKSKMDKLIKKRVYKDNVLYVGCCAGSIVAGKTMYPAHYTRQNEKSKKYYKRNFYKKKYFSKSDNNNSLKLVNKNIYPHCTKNKKTFRVKNKTFHCLKEYTPFTK